MKLLFQFVFFMEMNWYVIVAVGELEEFDEIKFKVLMLKEARENCLICLCANRL